MRVVVIGSGGREHALAWKIAQSPRVEQVLCLPGNAGTAAEEKVVNVPWRLGETGESVAAIVALEADLVVVGPEAPLVAGLGDGLRGAGMRVVGPDRAAARLEGSKSFAKALMEKAGVPTARAHVCRTMAEAEAAIDAFGERVPVVKADGLAAGKGVVVAESVQEARAAARDALVRRRFGTAGETVVIEERLFGVEASYIVLTDGRCFAPLPTTQDHKRLLEGDRGPNTGGMGAYLPNPFVTPDLEATVQQAVIIPMLQAMRSEGLEYRGFLYAGLMLTDSGPRVLEFNVRAGDPETQPILFGLNEDLVPCLEQVAEGDLAEGTGFSARPTVSVVLASRGYPGKAEVGHPIEGLDVVRRLEDVTVFHAGTRDGERGVETSGGRVLAVTARAERLSEAWKRAYAAAERVRFEGVQYRRDIGRRAL